MLLGGFCQTNSVSYRMYKQLKGWPEPYKAKYFNLEIRPKAVQSFVNLRA